MRARSQHSLSKRGAALARFQEMLSKFSGISPRNCLLLMFVLFQTARSPQPPLQLWLLGPLLWPLCPSLSFYACRWLALRSLCLHLVKAAAVLELLCVWASFLKTLRAIISLDNALVKFTWFQLPFSCLFKNCKTLCLISVWSSRGSLLTPS